MKLNKADRLLGIENRLRSRFQTEANEKTTPWKGIAITLYDYARGEMDELEKEQAQ